MEKRQGKQLGKKVLWNQQPSSTNYQLGKTRPTFSVKGQLFKGLCTWQGKVVFLLLSHHLHHQDETNLGPKFPINKTWAPVIVSYSVQQSPRASQPLDTLRGESELCNTHSWPQHHGMLELGRHLWSSPSPSSLPRKGCLDPLGQDHVPTASEDLQGGGFHHFSGQTMPPLYYPNKAAFLTQPRHKWAYLFSAFIWVEKEQWKFKSDRNWKISIAHSIYHYHINRGLCRFGSYSGSIV